jgi:adenosylhomocysteine nucleosidase
MPREPSAAGIVFALPVEADAFAARARDAIQMQAAGLEFHEGTIAGSRVAWVVAGAGLERAERACRLLLDGHRPGLIVSAGFAGGLAAGIERGRVVSPVRAIRGEQDSIPLMHVGVSGVASAEAIVTIDHVACTAHEKQSLAATTGADLVDMETWGVARAARDAGLECVGLRVVSDTVSDELPREMATLVKPQSSLRRLGSALRAVGRRPSAVVDMWRLWENAVVDARTLADAIERLIGRLPASRDAVSGP